MRKFKMNMFKDGMVVEHRNGKRSTITTGKFSLEYYGKYSVRFDGKNNSFLIDGDFNDDLTNNRHPHYDIMKVYYNDKIVYNRERRIIWK